MQKRWIIYNPDLDRLVTSSLFATYEEAVEVARPDDLIIGIEIPVEEASNTDE